MKRIISYFVLEFVLVQCTFAYTIKLCFPEKYKKYEGPFNRAFETVININEWGNRLEYSYYQTIEDYVKSLSLYKCDVAMVEPALYDQFYDSITSINYLNNKEVNQTLIDRMNDPIDGEIYSELIKDIIIGDKVEVKAFPLFIDYGILYYRKDINVSPPDSWDDLKSLDEFREDLDFSVSNTIYIGQFNEFREFFYNLFENVLNTREKINYEVVEKETYNTIKIFKQLFDNEIIDEYAWHLNSEYGVIRFNERKSVYMRNWSSFLYNITTSFNRKKGKNDNASFGIKKMLYDKHSKTANQSRAINKGIYICVSTNSKSDYLDDSILVAKTFSEKEFMKLLIEDSENIFYDIPAYHSLIDEVSEEEKNNFNNTEYCNRIGCDFFRELAVDHIIPTYSIFHQDEFLEKLTEFFEKAKQFFKSSNDEPDEYDSSTISEEKEIVTIDILMNSFADYFKDKYVEFGSPTTIIMIIIVAIEIIITCVVTYYLVKHRNFIEIRRSSPLFLITMLVGIILAFCSILTYIGKPTKFICILRPYVLVFTFGLTFFSLLLKTFRIKVIFDKVNIQVKDSNLIMYLCILLGFELILVTIWSIAAGMEPVVKMVSKEMHYYVCQNNKDLGKYIQTALIVINGLTLVYGCYLAYKVKNVYSEYNESKVIGLSIYGIVICMIILMFIVNIKGLDHTTLFLIQSLMIILSADIILVFMFTPKLWKLHINIISEIPYEKQGPTSTDKKGSNADQENNNNNNNNNVSLKKNALPEGDEQ
ncbi:7 transmembrane sweet-taste receptor of 3 GCPR-domain-containing protein [Neocallimastix sp. 'constans']|jgi:hypothetical protein